MMPVALATEDALSEAVGLRLLGEHAVLKQDEPLLLRKGGFGYLRSRMDSWKQMAQQRLVVLITDLDKVDCPVRLLDDWLGAGCVCPENLIFRIAVREVESWLLADHHGLAQLLGQKIKPPSSPDMLPDPKQHLLGLAKKAPRAVKEDLLARDGVIARQGLGYNHRLVNWVKTEWCPQRAEDRSPSLARTRHALNQAVIRVTKAGV
jgi:hypothetical protein